MFSQYVINKHKYDIDIIQGKDVWKTYTVYFLNSVSK